MARPCIVPSCNAAASDLLKIALCGRHAITVHQEVSEMLATRATNSARVAAGAKNRARPQGGQRQGCVYFMRFGDLVKIGFTSDLLGRIAALKPDELLATTPGTMRDEKALHARFGPHWVEGEYFRDNPEIRAYIEGLS